MGRDQEKEIFISIINVHDQEQNTIGMINIINMINERMIHKFIKEMKNIVNFKNINSNLIVNTTNK